MVLAVFPIGNLIGVFIRQISKPVANIIVSQAKQHRFFRENVCMPPAQFYNRAEIRLKMWSLNLGKPVHIPQLSEATAIELGAHLLGEFIVFAIAASVVTLEYLRQLRKEAKKQEIREEAKQLLLDHISELQERVEIQNDLIKEMTHSLSKLGQPIQIKIRKENANSELKDL